MCDLTKVFFIFTQNTLYYTNMQSVMCGLEFGWNPYCIRKLFSLMRIIIIIWALNYILLKYYAWWRMIKLIHAWLFKKVTLIVILRLKSICLTYERRGIWPTSFVTQESQLDSSYRVMCLLLGWGARAEKRLWTFLSARVQGSLCTVSL